ncbi:nuclear transport factor 2 family protein [Aliikangiella coralliicola]|uniref:nuclear transport factor 2 family protein n=1 Tax=Aliikangiella coralliicola TaxID=2592383 RepID=UPI00143D712D|nr:nuclear transport factor 2 family protein [Aliikangiella coralliicola]
MRKIFGLVLIISNAMFCSTHAGEDTSEKSIVSVPVSPKTGEILTGEQLTDEQMPPEIVVQAQLEAYNKGDIDAFVNTYAKDVKIYNHPNSILYSGHDRIRKVYGELFKTHPDLNVTIQRRIVQGNFVIDHELAVGLVENKTITVAAVYEVIRGKIQNVWFIQ